MTPEQAAYVPDIVKNAMLVAWREICGDTGCHPLDIEHGKGKYLTFEPRHWAKMSGDIVAVQIAKLVEAEPIVAEFEGIFGKLTATERRWLTRRIAGQEV
jgi:hypothetical protein